MKPSSVICHWYNLFILDGLLAETYQGWINYQWQITQDGFINPYILVVSVTDQKRIILTSLNIVKMVIGGKAKVLLVLN
jgi:hypothetical protein